LFFYFKIITAISFALLSLAIWFVMVRPVPQIAAVGTVKRKTHKPEGAYWQYQAGDRPGFRVPTKITIAEGYVLEIESPEIDGLVYAVINTVEARDYEVGDQVELKYSVRSLPPIWSKKYVTEISKAK
jgi:hypothetical protein